MPDASPRRLPGRPRDPAREAAILTAAAEVLAEVGYERLTFEAVAARAGASRATLYRRWAGRAELVAAALRHSVDAAVPVPNTGSVRDDLIALLCWYAGDRSDAKTGQLAGVVHAMRTDTELREVVLGQLVDVADTTATSALVKRGQHRGELGANADPSLLTEVMTALLYLRSLILVAPVDDAWIKRMVDTVLLPVLTGAHPNPAR